VPAHQAGVFNADPSYPADVVVDTDVPVGVDDS
jgi:hypothetical protein